MRAHFGVLWQVCGLGPGFRQPTLVDGTEFRQIPGEGLPIPRPHVTDADMILDRDRKRDELNAKLPNKSRATICEGNHASMMFGHIVCSCDPSIRGAFGEDGLFTSGPLYAAHSAVIRLRDQDALRAIVANVPCEAACRSFLDLYVCCLFAYDDTPG